MRNAVLGLGFLLVGSATGYTLAGPPDQLSSPTAGADNVGESLLCSGGASSDLEVEFSTALVSAQSGQERASLQLELSNRAKAPMKAAHVIEFVDHHGNAIITPVRGPNVNISGSAHVEAARFDTPAGLSDGFYMARATVVATGGGLDASELRHIYFEVRNGQLNEIDIEDYLTRSDANKGESL